MNLHAVLDGDEMTSAPVVARVLRRIRYAGGEEEEDADDFFSDMMTAFVFDDDDDDDDGGCGSRQKIKECSSETKRVSTATRETRADASDWFSSLFC